jgi:transglycosylase-like protein
MAGIVGASLALPVPAFATHSQNSAQETMQHKMYKLRMCESHNNYRANTGNGYYGAYQFAEGTWRSLGFRGRPDRASRRTQNRAAIKLHHRDGWHPWPACARREHLYS